MARLMRMVRSTIDQPQLPTCAVHPAQEAHEDDHDGADPVPDRHHPLELVPELRHRLVVLRPHEELHRLARSRRPPPPAPPRASRPAAAGRVTERTTALAAPPGRHEERGEVLALDAHPAHPVERLAGRRQLGRREQLDPARQERDAAAAPGSRGRPAPPGSRCRRPGPRGAAGPAAGRCGSPTTVTLTRPDARKASVFSAATSPSENAKRSVCGSVPDTDTASDDGR